MYGADTVAQERLWTWLSLGFAAAAMLTSLFALTTDPTYRKNPDKSAEIDYMDETPDEATLDQMRGLGMTSTDN